MAQGLIPNRDKGRNRFNTNGTFKPSTDEALITVSSTDGSWIDRFSGLAEDPNLFSHR